MPSRPLALATLVALSCVGGEAAAYCRSTTCDPRKTDCPRDEEGCKLTGQPLAWRSSCPGLSLHPSGTRNLDAAEVERVLAASMGAWSALRCEGDETASFAWARLAPSSCPVGYRRGLPNANVIMFRDDAWPHQGAENTLGFTTVTYDVETGEILDSDTELNTAQNPVTTGDLGVKYDLESILTHELGHALGLSHSADPNATMYATYDRGTTDLRTLSPDDVDAVCVAYPATREAVCSTSPVNGFSPDCAESPAPSDDGGGCNVASTQGRPAALAVALLVLALRGRRWGRHASHLLLDPLAARRLRRWWQRRRRLADATSRRHQLQARRVRVLSHAGRRLGPPAVRRDGPHARTVSLRSRQFRALHLRRQVRGHEAVRRRRRALRRLCL